MVAGYNNVETLNIIWDWAEETQLNRNELKKKLLLHRDMHGFNAWHRAADQGYLYEIEIIWIWTKEAEINKYELLLSQTKCVHNAFQLAARNNHVETLKGMWDWPEETQLNPNELKNKLFLSKDSDRYMAWHHAVDQGTLEALETLWIWAKKSETKHR